MKKVKFISVAFILFIFLMQIKLFALPRGITKGRMEVTQQLMQTNIYGKDIFQGVFMYTYKRGARGYVVPMVTVYNKSNSVLLQAFTYIDFTERTLLKGAYVQFYIYIPHVENYDHHAIELYLVESSAVNNYETVAATQALFAKEIAEKRRTKITVSATDLELLNKHRRNLKPTLVPPPPGQNGTSKAKSASNEKEEIDWNSPFTYGYKWGGFDKKDNFLKY